MKDNKLGRGISDLMFENNFDISTDEMIHDIDINQIKANPDQPRTFFKETALDELANSIEEHGVLQPIIVKQSGTGYILVAGERRLKACKKLGLSTVPAIVREYNSIYLAELALLENLQREDLTAIEEAIALQKLQQMNDITHDELGKKIGKSRSYITNALGLLKLPKKIIEDLNNGILSSAHARVLSKLNDDLLIMELRDKIVEDELNVRQLEELVRSLKGNDPVISTTRIKTAKQEVKQIFSNDTKFSLTSKSLSFKFKNEEELEKLLKLLRTIRSE